MGWIETVQPWQWLVLGMILLIAETFGFGGFLIGIAIASIIQSGIAMVWPNLHWALQLAVFALNAIVATVLYWKLFKPFNQKTDQKNINDRAAQLIGRTMRVEHDIENGDGRIQVGDTFWRIRCDKPLKEGDHITVVATEGMLLLVELD